MHKNPFVPQPPPYNPPQPPLPPGPPPPQAGQPDYSGYWAAATAAAAAQPQPQQAYNPQWPSAPAPAPLPPRPPPEQSALYANYGYGGSQNFQWQHQQHQHQHQQQQQQQQQQQRAQPALFQPPQPPPQPPAIQPYTPYQPQAVAGFLQPYVPQAPPIPQQPAPVIQNLYNQQPQQPARQFFPQQQRSSQSFNHPSPQHLHHTPPQHLPPAKRQKFDGPGAQHRGPQPLPQPPQFQPPPQSSASVSGSVMQQQQQQQQQQPMSSGSFSSGRGGGPGSGPMGRGGGPTNRGGNRGRGGSMVNNRGGTGRGRGGGMYSGNRGGSQTGNQLKGHSSRGNFGGGRDYGNRDHGNRRGGSFVSGGGGHHQGAGGASFRGRGQGHAYSHFSRGGRHDGGSGSFTSRDGPMSSSNFLTNSSGSGKKDENRRNFTDFKIVGLEILDLSWAWGVIPTTRCEIKAESIQEGLSSSPSADSEDTVSQAASQPAKEESADLPTPSLKTREDPEPAPVKGETTSDLKAIPSTLEGHAVPQEVPSLVEMPAPAAVPPPPSRMRIYFHSPVTPDDCHPILSGSSFPITGSEDTSSRRGKRKKSEDDDGDLEEGRAPPPPPGGSRPERSMSVDRFERASTAPSAEPSVAETASEGDWLMAAIGEDEGDGEDDGGEPQLSRNDPIRDETTCVADGEYGSLDDGVATQVDDSEGIRDLMDEPSSLMDGQTLDNVREASPLTSYTATRAVDVPEAQDQAESLDMSGSPGVAVAEQLAVAPHPEQLDGALSGPFETPGPIESQNDLATSVPPAEEGPLVVSPSSSAPAIPDSSVIASSSSSDTSVAAPPTESAAPDEEQPADHTHSPDLPVPNAPDESTTSSASIIERLLVQGESGDPRAQGADDLQDDSATQPEVHFDGPASSDTSTLISGSTASAYGEPNRRLPLKAEPQPGIRTPSANRLSISYAAGTKRLVINAEIVEKLKIHRSDGRVEIRLRVEKDDVNGLNGIIVESLSETTKSYSSLDTSSPAVELDPTVPPFSKTNVPSEVALLVYLDRARPLSEPKWVKSGDVQEWLKSMFGRMFWFTRDAAGSWERKIEVVDPDPAPTIWTVLDGWAANSTVGLQTERQRFVRTHMVETDNVLEILLRLVRGERATPFTQAAPAISAPSVSGPLLAALSPSSAHGSQQTHVSLAVLAVWRMTLEYAQKALQEKGRTEAEEHLGEIIRCLPSHLLYKSLDGIFKEWKVEKKSGR